MQWYGTTPVTVPGKFILGLISGIIGFAVIGCGTSPVGIAYTIISANIICMFIRILEEKQNEIITSKVISKYTAKITAESGVQK